MAAKRGASSAGSCGKMPKLEVSGDAFDCPICMVPMVGHIYLCPSGHSICEECYDKLPDWRCPQCSRAYPAEACRNRTLEAMAATVLFECQWGCGTKARPDDLRSHMQSECPKALRGCPVEGCAEMHTAAALLEHIQTAHTGDGDAQVDWWKTKTRSHIQIDGDDYRTHCGEWEDTLITSFAQQPLFVRMGIYQGAFTVKVSHFLEPVKFAVTLSGEDPATHSVTVRGVTAIVANPTSPPPQVCLCRDAGRMLWHPEADRDGALFPTLGIEVSVHS